jgi:hypothetical protein
MIGQYEALVQKPVGQAIGKGGLIGTTEAEHSLQASRLKPIQMALCPGGGPNRKLLQQHPIQPEVPRRLGH